jgi:hypothetical protein
MIRVSIGFSIAPTSMSTFLQELQGHRQIDCALCVIDHGNPRGPSLSHSGAKSEAQAVQAAGSRNLKD